MTPRNVRVTMKKILAVLGFLLLLAPCGYCQEANQPLQFTIASEKEAYNVSEPIMLTGKITNLGRSPVTILTGDLHTRQYGWEAGTVNVINSGNKRMPCGVRGQARVSGKSDFLTLEPDETKIFRFNLLDCCGRRLPPDTYTITCHYFSSDFFYDEHRRLVKVKFPWRGILKSNPITIKVVKSKISQE